MKALTPQQESRLLSGDEQIDTIRSLVGLFDDQGAVIGDVGPAINKAYEVLSHAALLHPEQEAIAKLLWHRFGDSNVEEWEDESHKAEFLEAADDVLFRARARQGATLLPGEMQSAIRAWLQCPAEKRPSPAALGQRITEIAAAALLSSTAASGSNDDRKPDATRSVSD